MKKSIIVTLILGLSYSVSFSQETEKQKLRESSVVVEPSTDYTTNYLINEAELKACFKNGIVPTNFPKVSDSGDQESYKVQVGYYVNENSHLFNPEEVKKYGYTVVEKQNVDSDEYSIYKRKKPLSQDELKQKELKSNPNN